MSGNNSNLKRQAERNNYYFQTGEQVGFQRCLDYMQALLRNPKYMGRDTFGRKRWELLYEGLKECDKLYGDAFTFGVEADYCQEGLDAQIRAIFGDDALSFMERYPMLKETKYDKPKKGWV
jgi:hypothetical protein